MSRFCKYVMIIKIFVFLFSFNLIISKDLQNDVRWVVKSNEYKALTNQIYSMAWIEIKSDIKKFKCKNLAVVMDLDETVLDNSGYQIFLSESNQSYNPKTWDDWVVKEKANLVPGAQEFIKNLRKKNIQLIFISNRMDLRLEETKRNMDALGVLGSDDIFLLRLDKADKKTVRRDEIFNSTGRMEGKKRYKVIAYFGDAMGDFPTDKESKFGTEYFILPNPMYGKW